MKFPSATRRRAGEPLPVRCRPPAPLRREAAVQAPGRLPFRVLPLAARPPRPAPRARHADQVLAARIGPDPPGVGRHLRRPQDHRRAPRGAAEPVNHKRVARLMRRRRIVGVHLRTQVRTTVRRTRRGHGAGPARPRLHRAPRRTRSTSETSPISRSAGAGSSTWQRCSTSHSKRLVGWSIADHMRTGLSATPCGPRAAPAAETCAERSSTPTTEPSTSPGLRRPCRRVRRASDRGAPSAASADNAARGVVQRQLETGDPPRRKRWPGDRDARLETSSAGSTATTPDADTPASDTTARSPTRQRPKQHQLR